jgi:hypothetical protein
MRADGLRVIQTGPLQELLAVVEKPHDNGPMASKPVAIHRTQRRAVADPVMHHADLPDVGCEKRGGGITRKAELDRDGTIKPVNQGAVSMHHGTGAKHADHNTSS